MYAIEKLGIGFIGARTTGNVSSLLATGDDIICLRVPGDNSLELYYATFLTCFGRKLQCNSDKINGRDS